MSTQYWTDQLFWSTPIVYEAMDTFGLDERVVIEFVDPFLHRATVLARARVVQGHPWDTPHGVIEFSKYFWQRLSAEDRRAVLVHEAAHIIDSFKHGWSDHGPDWKAIMVQLGEPPDRCYQGHTDIVPEKGPH